MFAECRQITSSSLLQMISDYKSLLSAEESDQFYSQITALFTNSTENLPSDFELDLNDPEPLIQSISSDTTTSSTNFTTSTNHFAVASSNPNIDTTNHYATMELFLEKAKDLTSNSRNHKPLAILLLLQEDKTKGSSSNYTSLLRYAYDSSCPLRVQILKDELHFVKSTNTDLFNSCK